MLTARPSCEIADLLDRYRVVRRHSEAIASNLCIEDCVIQSMPDASPIRWHLAHTTWFFETFLLKAFTDYRSTNEAFEVLFNSYYNTVGEQFPRERRGLLSRPTVDEVLRYREDVDQAVESWMANGFAIANHNANDDSNGDSDASSPASVLEVGLQHEQQHQELMLTDVQTSPFLQSARSGDV